MAPAAILTFLTLRCGFLCSSLIPHIISYSPQYVIPDSPIHFSVRTKKKYSIKVLMEKREAFLKRKKKKERKIVKFKNIEKKTLY